MNFIEWVQTRLRAHDFNPGIVDGIWGRNTMNAVIAFQIAKGINASGSLDNATVAALRVQPAFTDTGTSTPTSVPGRSLFDLVPWMALALRKKGMHEKDDNRDLSKFLKSDGKTLGDPAKLPWCGDFVETCIALTLPSAVLPNNPYLARNWQKFGQAVEPCFGAVMVFWRESISGNKGHVGFYYSEDSSYFHILGGNQSNKVSVSRIKRNRLLSAQMPTVGGPYPRKKINGAGDFKITDNEF